MAMQPDALKKILEAALLAALIKEFSKEGSADPTSHKRLAAAIAEGVSLTLIPYLQSSAQVIIASGSSAGPTGKIT